MGAQGLVTRGLSFPAGAIGSLGTWSRVEQSLVFCGEEEILPATLGVSQMERRPLSYKYVIFFLAKDNLQVKDNLP